MWLFLPRLSFGLLESFSNAAFCETVCLLPRYGTSKMTVLTADATFSGGQVPSYMVSAVRTCLKLQIIAGRSLVG